MNDYSVQKQLKRHCAGTVQSQGGRVRNVKQVGFEPGPEDSNGRCGSDKIRQTVPDVSSGDRKSSVTDGRQGKREHGDILQIGFL